jgi:hypothetical protein
MPPHVLDISDYEPGTSGPSGYAEGSTTSPATGTPIMGRNTGTNTLKVAKMDGNDQLYVVPVGSLPVKGVYNTTPPTLTNGQDTVFQVDVNGNQKVTLATTLAGEDIANDVQKVEERYLPLNVSTAATTVVKSGSGYVKAIRVIGGTLGTVTVYDNTSASGTVLVPTVTPTAAGLLIESITFSTGLTIVTGSATILTGAYR